MPSIRKQIRAALAAQLAPHFVKTFGSHQHSIAEASLPAAQVFFDGGAVDEEFDQSETTRADLVVQIFARSSGAIDDALDDLAELAVDAILANPTLGGLVDRIFPAGFEYDWDDNGPLGSLSLSFRVIYGDDL